MGSGIPLTLLAGVVIGLLLASNIKYYKINILINRVLYAITLALVFFVGYNAGRFTTAVDKSMLSNLISNIFLLLILSIIISIVLTGVGNAIKLRRGER